MHIKIFRSGCANCAALERRSREALADPHLTADITKVTDYGEIAGFGVIRTPALVVDEQVLLAGRVPDRATVAGLLTAAAPEAS